MMKLKLPQHVQKLIEELEKNGHSAYVVGGGVRDSLRGAAPEDYDVATSAKPWEVKEIFHSMRVVETGIRHGTVTVIDGGKPVEITTYRMDGQYSDCRHPDRVTFTDSILEDLSRRDFTINAIAYNERIGLVDKFGGEADIRNKVIRCVGAPDERFQEDALRILRAIRFMAQTGFEIHRTTYLAMTRHKENLRNVAGERIQKEIDKIIMGRYAAPALFKCSSILAVVFPELQEEFLCHQHSVHHYYDVWEHTVRAVSVSAYDRMVRLTMLFHDVGKPATKCFDNLGRGHFPGHAKIGAKIAENTLQRLHYDRETVETVGFLIDNHSLDLGMDEKIVRRRLAKMGEVNFRRLIQVQKADCCGKGHDYARLARLLQTERILQTVLQKQQCFCLKHLAVNGNDLLELGLCGKEVGRVLQLLLDKVLEDQSLNNPVILKELARNEVPYDG